MILLPPLVHPVEEIHLGGEVVGAVLRHIAHLGVFGPLHHALVGRHLAGQTVEQGRFAHTVRADDGHAFTHRHHQIEILEQHLAVETFAQVIHFQRQPVQFLALLETDVRVLAAGRLDVIQFDFIDLFGTRGGLTGLGGIGGEATHKLFEIVDLRLLPCVVGHGALAHFGRGNHEIVVVTWIKPQFAEIEIGNMRADAVQEVSVMRNDDHRTFARVENFFQPAYGVDVQVVGGLVEQEDVGITKQRLRQQHAELPAWRHFAHQTHVLFDRNAEAHEEFASAGFAGVAVEFGEMRFEFGGEHAVFFGHLGFGVELVARVLHLPEFLVPHDHGVDDREFLERKLVLTQLAESLIRPHRHVTVGGLELPGQDFHQRRFAAAVGANQAIAMAVAKFNRDVFEQGFGTKLDGEVGSGQHGRIPD